MADGPQCVHPMCHYFAERPDFGLHFDDFVDNAAQAAESTQTAAVLTRRGLPNAKYNYVFARAVPFVGTSTAFAPPNYAWNSRSSRESATTMKSTHA